MWSNKKYGKRKFKGAYLFTKSDRVFTLTEQRSDARKPKVISLESWQQAKKQGWVKS